MLQGRLWGVLSSKRPARVKGAEGQRVFPGSLKGFQGSFKGLSRKIEGGFNGVLSRFQWCMFQKKFNRCLREVL